jgi:hypothetical protein
MDSVAAACKYGAYDEVAAWLKSKPDDVEIPMCYAARYGHINIIRLLHTYNPDIDMSDVIGNAAECGHSNICRELITWGASPQAGLYGACLGGHIELVRYFLAYPIQREHGLNLACYRGHMDIIELLLANETKFQYDAFCHAVEGKQPAVVTMLLERYSALIDPCDGYYGWIRDADIRCMKIMLEHYDGNYAYIRPRDIEPLVHAGMPLEWFTARWNHFTQGIKSKVRALCALRRLHIAAIQKINMPKVIVDFIAGFL